MDPVLQVIAVVGMLAAFVCVLIYFARWRDNRQRNGMKAEVRESKNDVVAAVKEMKSDIMAEIKELRDKVDYNSERLSYIEGKLDRAFPEGMTPPGAARPGGSGRPRGGASERKRVTG